MNQKNKFVGVTLLTLFVMAAIAVLLLKTSTGEDLARRAVVDRASSAMQGKLSIRQLENIELFSPFGVARATVSGVEVLGSDGRLQLEIGELTAELRLIALLTGKLHVPRATVSGVLLPYNPETGSPRFVMPRTSKREPFKPRDTSLLLEKVDVVGLHLVARGAKGEKVMIGRMSGELDLLVPGNVPGVQVQLRRIKGEVAQPRGIKVLEASGEIDTSAHVVADIEFSVITEGTNVTGNLRYVPSDRNDPMKVGIQNVRDAGMLNGNPLDMLQGKGIPMQMFDQFPGAR